MNKQTILTALTISGFLTLSSSAAKALTWNYSFTSTLGDAAGTITTDGTAPAQPNLTYNISAIDGIFTPTGGTAQSILGLNSTFQGPDNTLQWDGTANSSLIVSTAGISFDTLVNSYNIFNSGLNQYGAATDLSDSSLDNYSLTSSSLAPAASSAVPFEFSPEQGFMLGLPVFLGLRQLKKKNSAATPYKK
jgi:hypothetical protein